MPLGSVAARVAGWARLQRNLPGPLQGASRPGVALLDEFVPGYGFAVLAGPGVDVTTPPSTWALVDWTKDVYQGGDGTQGVVITRARGDEQSVTASASCTLMLKNPVGDYTPRRVQSQYFPYIREGFPLQTLVYSANGTFERFAGTVDDIDPQWDETGNAPFVQITAHGVWQTLTLDDSPSVSAMTRTVSAASPPPIAWWPLEDGATSTQAASGLPLGLPLRVTGTVNFASGDGAPGTGPLADLSSGGQLYAALPTITASSYTFEYLIKCPTVSDFKILMDLATVPGGGIDLWEVVITDIADGGLYVQWANSSTFGGPFVSNVAVDDNVWHHIRMTLSNSGGNHKIVVSIDGTVAITQTTAQAWTVGASVAINPIGDPDLQLPQFGQLIVWSGSPSVNTVDAAQGHPGEDPIVRLARLCLENGIPFGSDSVSAGKAMGPQTVAPLQTLLRDAEKVAGGVLEDGVGFGLWLWTLAGRYNQAPTMTPALQQVVPPLLPVENNLLRANKAIVSRPNGSSATYVQPAGQPYAPSGPGGVGVKPVPDTVNVQSDGALIDYASWRVRLGTVDVDRYPTLSFDFAARPQLLDSWLACRVGSRILVGTNYPTGGLPPDATVEGWTETLSRVTYKVTVNGSPTDTWRVATYGVSRYDSTTSTLALPAPAGSASLLVATTSAHLWSLTAAPFDLNVGGLLFTATSVTGSTSPQTIAVTGPLNGIVKDLPVGTPVRLRDTPRYAL